jgi:O-antigen/teichoic acid export membrane protein
MGQLAALGAYVYQAVLALGLLLLVSRLLPAQDFTHYSLFITISQFGSIAAFEWLRFSCSRFYPGTDETAQRSVMLYAFVVCAALCLLVGGGISAFGAASLGIAMGGALVAVFQGGSELHLTMLRFRQDFRLFSILQAVRASFLAIGTVCGALLDPRLGGAVSGMLIAYLAYAAVARFLSGSLANGLRRPQRHLLAKHLTYGGVSAGASVAGILAPLGLKTFLTAVVGAQGAAGALLALDLLQRPFVMVVSALQAIRYPEIVATFDREPDMPAFRERLGAYYAALASCSLVAAAAILCLLAPAAAWLVKAELRDSFLLASPAVTLLALLRAWVQTLLPTPAHLTQRLRPIIGLALADAVLLNLGAVTGWYLSGGALSGLLFGSLAGAAAAVAAGAPLFLSMPFRWHALTLGSALAALVVAALANAGAPRASLPISLAVFLLCIPPAVATLGSLLQRRGVSPEAS